MLMLRMAIGFLLCVFLASCTATNPPSAEPLLNKERKLESPRLLTQTEYIPWISWSKKVDLYVIERPGQPHDCEISHKCRPTVSEYTKNPAAWQSWHVENGTHFRIVNVLPAGTLYHFFRIDVPDCRDCYPVFYATIDSGPYQGWEVYYRFDYSNPDDVRVVHQLSP